MTISKREIYTELEPLYNAGLFAAVIRIWQKEQKRIYKINTESDEKLYHLIADCYFEEKLFSQCLMYLDALLLYHDSIKPGLDSEEILDDIMSMKIVCIDNLFHKKVYSMYLAYTVYQKIGGTNIEFTKTAKDLENILIRIAVKQLNRVVLSIAIIFAIARLVFNVPLNNVGLFFAFVFGAYLVIDGIKPEIFLNTISAMVKPIFVTLARAIILLHFTSLKIRLLYGISASPALKVRA